MGNLAPVFIVTPLVVLDTSLSQGSAGKVLTVAERLELLRECPDCSAVWTACQDSF